MKIPYVKSGYGGFVIGDQDVNINQYKSNFDEVEGSSTSDYVVILLSSNISSSNYDKILFSNDLGTCESELHRWLNQVKRPENSNDWAMSRHWYGMIGNIKNDKIIGFGDVFEDDGQSWRKFAGCEDE